MPRQHGQLQVEDAGMIARHVVMETPEKREARMEPEDKEWDDRWMSVHLVRESWRQVFPCGFCFPTKVGHGPFTPLDAIPKRSQLFSLQCVSSRALI